MHGPSLATGHTWSRCCVLYIHTYIRYLVLRSASQPPLKGELLHMTRGEPTQDKQGNTRQYVRDRYRQGGLRRPVGFCALPSKATHRTNGGRGACNTTAVRISSTHSQGKNKSFEISKLAELARNRRVPDPHHNTDSNQKKIPHVGTSSWWGSTGTKAPHGSQA